MNGSESESGQTPIATDDNTHKLTTSLSTSYTLNITDGGSMELDDINRLITDSPYRSRSVESRFAKTRKSVGKGEDKSPVGFCSFWIKSTENFKNL